MKEPRWLKDSVALAIHRRQLAEHGGLDGVRDAGMLASAFVRPRDLFAYRDPKPDAAVIAAAYAFGIIRNHPFVDGNKRTACVLYRTFLKLNGVDIDAPEANKYLTFVAVADGSLNEDGLVAWIRAHLVKAPPNR
jgi:death-on-curing protein